MATPLRMLVALLAGALVQSPWTADRGDGSYRNPILYADYSDPDAIRVGDDFYLIASSFTAVPGLPILHSRDLVNWTLVAHALPRLVPDDVFLAPQHGGGVWAPALRHHAGRFWIYYPDPDRGIYVVTATQPAGPWSAPVLVKAGKGLIDPCPLWDDDGRVYLVHAWARSRAGFANAITLVELDTDGTRAVDEGRNIIDGGALAGYTTLEGPKIYKRDGYYYVFAPAGGVKQGWQSVFRSRSLYGPYEGRVVLAQGRTDINGPHQGALVDTASGEWWFLHFQDLDAYGRVVHLQPVAWRDGWPVIGKDGEPVRTHRKPAVAPVARSGTAGPQTSDEFDARAPGPQWQWQANPQPHWWKMTGGSLMLTPVPANLWLAPNLLLQKLPAPAFTATTLATLDPSSAERAGLVVFGTDYGWIGLRNGHVVLAVNAGAAEGKLEREVASAAVPGREVYLRAVVRDGARVEFSYSTDGSAFTVLGAPFAAKPGRWVGAKIGLFGPAFFSWFRIERID